MLDDTDADTTMGMFLSKGTGDALRAAGALSTVGLAFVLALVIGFWFGTLLDGWLRTKPVFTIVFFFFGLAAAVLNVYRIVSRAYPKPTGPPEAPSGTQGPQARSSEAGAGPDERELSNGD